MNVALLSTAAVGSPGSMRAYADTLMSALATHCPDVEVELFELDPEPASSRWRRRFQMLSVLFRAYRLNRRPPHVWHILDGSQAYHGLRLRTAPVVVTVHDVIPWLQDQGKFRGVGRLGRAARFWWEGNGRSMRRASTLVCDSSRTALDTMDSFGVPLEACQIVPLPLRSGMAGRILEVGGVTREAGRLLHVGNNGFYKNRQGALRIFSAIDGGRARCIVMAGPPPNRELLELAVKLGISDRVRWLHDPSDAELAEEYAKATVLVFPSLYEGFGWPVLEAMSFGLPVVTSNAGSLPEVVGEAGAMRSPEDEIGMARAIEDLLESPALQLVASQRGSQRAREFSAWSFAQSMRGVYRAAAGLQSKVSA